MRWMKTDRGVEWVKRKRKTSSGVGPLIIHGALSTPIEGENHSCEPESSQRALSPSSLPLFNPSASFNRGGLCLRRVGWHREQSRSNSVA